MISTTGYDIDKLHVVGRAEFPMLTKCSGYDAFGRGGLWRKASDAPRISGRKRPWRDACGGIVGSPRAKWIPRNHVPTWELRGEDQRGHIVAPLRLPIETMDAQLYNFPDNGAPWPSRILASAAEGPAQASAQTSPSGHLDAWEIAAESGRRAPAQRTDVEECIAPEDQIGSFRKCTGRGISGRHRVWRQEYDAPRWADARHPRFESCGIERGSPRGKWIPKDHVPTWEIRRG